MPSSRLAGLLLVCLLPRSCDADEANKPWTTHEDVVASCADFVCPTGWENKAANPSTVRLDGLAPSEDSCCERTCASFDCAAEGKPWAARLGDPWEKKWPAAGEPGRPLCCERTCAGFACPTGWGSKADDLFSVRLDSQSPSESACCDRVSSAETDLMARLYADAMDAREIMGEQVRVLGVSPNLVLALVAGFASCLGLLFIVIICLLAFSIVLLRRLVRRVLGGDVEPPPLKEALSLKAATLYPRPLSFTPPFKPPFKHPFSKPPRAASPSLPTSSPPLALAAFPPATRPAARYDSDEDKVDNTPIKLRDALRGNRKAAASACCYSAAEVHPALWV